MKFKLHEATDFDEEFTSKSNKESHYKKHIKNKKEYNMTPDEYEKAAEDLAKTPVNYSNILGYAREDGTYCKYNKDTELFTAYTYIKGVPKTITAFRMSYRKFTGKKADDYFDEIPQGK